MCKDQKGKSVHMVMTFQPYEPEHMARLLSKSNSIVPILQKEVGA